MRSLIFARELKSRDALYLQIAAGLRRSIVQGQFKAEEQLPSISDMAKELGVSVVTVRSAVAVLEEEGLVERIQGKGTFVAANVRANKGLVLNTSFAALLEHLAGKTAKVLEASDGNVLPFVNPTWGELTGKYHYMRRIHLADDAPYALINIHIDHDTYSCDKPRFDHSMVIPVLAEMPVINGGRMHQTVSFTTADPETARLLEVPVNSAIGNVLRVITDMGGKIIYVGQTKYRGDFVRLEMTYDRLGERVPN